MKELGFWVSLLAGLVLLGLALASFFGGSAESAARPLSARVAALEAKVKVQTKLLRCLRYEPVAQFGNVGGRGNGYVYLDGGGNTVYTSALNLARGDRNAFNMVIVPASCASLIGP